MVIEISRDETNLQAAFRVSCVRVRWPMCSQLGFMLLAKSDVL